MPFHSSSYHVVVRVVPSDVGFLPWNSEDRWEVATTTCMAKEKVLSKMLEAIHVQHFAPDAGHSWPFYFCTEKTTPTEVIQMMHTQSAVRHAQHAWFMSNLERNRLIQSLNMLGAPQTKNR